MIKKFFKRINIFSSTEKESDEGKSEYISTEQGSRKTRRDWVGIISEKNGWDRNRTEDFLRYLNVNYIIRPREIMKMDLNSLSETQLVVAVIKEREEKKKREDIYNIIEKETGKSRLVIQKEIKFLRCLDKNESIGLQSYYRFGGYEINFSDKESVKAWVSNTEYILQHIRVLRDYIDEKGYTRNIHGRVKELRSRIDATLSKGRRQQLFSCISDVRPDLCEKIEEYNRITTDMELTEDIWGFNGDEYAMFHFWKKSINERMKYVSGNKSRMILRELNGQKWSDILDNRYEAYRVLKDLYGREITLFTADDYDAFEKYCESHPVFVKKENYDLVGGGIKKVEIQDNADLKDIYNSITEEGRSIILEDLICPDNCIRRLNPDSVNTLSFITLRTDEEVSVEDAFLKVGRDGSFTNNWDAGGILAHIDVRNGITDSAGIGKSGEVFTRHPDHGYDFQGIQFPEWEKALSVVKKAAFKVPGLRFARWDLTYQKDTGWIIVGGNATPQFEQLQSTAGKGLLCELLITTKAYRHSNSEAFILSVMQGMKLCDWNIGKSEDDVLAAASAFGLTYREYYVNKFCTISDSKRDEFSEQLLRHRASVRDNRTNRRANKKSMDESSLTEVMGKTGWSRMEAIERMDEARRRTGAVYHDYARFHFWELSDEEQAKYFTYDKAIAIKKKYNSGHLKERLIATNKDVFCDVFDDYICRKWMSTANLELVDFCRTFRGENRLVYKPRGGTGGFGIRVYNLKDEECRAADSLSSKTSSEYSLENVYTELKGMPFGVIESYINQHPAMNRFSGESVNTVRIVTIRTMDPGPGLEKGKTYFIYAAMRMGAEDGFTDNLHAGGMVAAVDIDTGEVVTDAADYSGEIYKNHPVSGVKIKGFRIPYFAEMKKLISRASEELELEGYFGWDVAATSDAPELVELNINPGQGILQIPYIAEKKGMAHLFDQFVDWK